MLRRRKTIQQLVKCFFSQSKWLLAFTLLVLWLLSCSTGGPSSLEPRLLSYEGKVTDYADAAETLEIKLQLSKDSPDLITIGKVSFKTDGNFKLTLEKVDAKYLSDKISNMLYPEECKGLDISPKDWKGMAVSGLDFRLYKVGQEQGVLSATPILENAAVAFFYMDKDVSMKGSCTLEGRTYRIDASFKKGWTAVLATTNANLTTFLLTTPADIELTWSYKPKLFNDWLDPTFGDGGLITTDFAEGNDSAYSLAIDSNNKIVVVGASVGAFAVARYNPDGSLDTNFGDGGKVTTAFASGDATGHSVAIANDSKIVVAGESRIDANTFGFAVTRYNPDGSLDTSFGDAGEVITAFGDGYTSGQSVAVDKANKIVVAGFSSDESGTSVFAVARYNPDGSLDTSLSVDGKATTQFANGRDEGHSVAIDRDNKIVVAGSTTESGSSVFAIARYNP
jgi:uncharacterized delta-60 repeat protein